MTPILSGWNVGWIFFRTRPGKFWNSIEMEFFQSTSSSPWKTYQQANTPSVTQQHPSKNKGCRGPNWGVVASFVRRKMEHRMDFCSRGSKGCLDGIYKKNSTPKKFVNMTPGFSRVASMNLHVHTFPFLPKKSGCVHT